MARIRAAGKGSRAKRHIRRARRTYVLALILCLVFAFLQGGVIPSTLLYICLLVPPAALLHAAICRLCLLFEQTMPSGRIVKGETASFTLRFRNRGPAGIPYVRANLIGDHGLTLTQESVELSLMPRESARLSMPLHFPWRGVYTFGVSGVDLTDLFSLSRLSITPARLLRVTVFPKLVLLRRLGLSMPEDQTDGRRLTKNAEESSADSRKYLYGDPMSRIHWNLTAQKGELITRLYESDSDQDIAVLLDLAPLGLENPYFFEDLLLESCLAVCRYLLDNSHSLKLSLAVAGTIKTYVCADKASFDSLYAALAEVPFTSTRSLAELDRAAGAAGYRFIFTASDPMAGLSEHLTRRGALDIYRIVTAYGCERTRYENTSTLRLFDILPEDDLCGVLEGGA